MDSFPEIKLCLDKSLELFNINVEKELTSSLIGPPLDEILREIMPSQNQEDIEKIKLAYYRFYEDICVKSNLYDDAEMVLKKLSRKNKLYVLTNKSKLFSKKIIISKQIYSFFDDILCVDPARNDKSSKTKLLKSTMTKLKLSPKNCFLIGDSISDFNAAMKNKIKFFHAVWGYGFIQSTNARKINSLKNLFEEKDLI